MVLKVKRLNENAKLPTRSNPNDAGLDLYAIQDTILHPDGIIKIGTGIAIELPYGTVGLQLDRSSLGSKGIHNFAGVIDSNYRGELFVVLHNSTDKTFILKQGDRIAQLVIMPILLPTPIEVEELTNTERGINGFGSSGV
jgi:dUTP pyrophosphatase